MGWCVRLGSRAPCQISPRSRGPVDRAGCHRDGNSPCSDRPGGDTNHSTSPHQARTRNRFARPPQRRSPHSRARARRRLEQGAEWIRRSRRSTHSRRTLGRRRRAAVCHVEWRDNRLPGQALRGRQGDRPSPTGSTATHPAVVRSTWTSPQTRATRPATTGSFSTRSTYANLADMLEIVGIERGSLDGFDIAVRPTGGAGSIGPSATSVPPGPSSSQPLETPISSKSPQPIPQHSSRQHPDQRRPSGYRRQSPLCSSAASPPCSSRPSS